MDNKAVIATVLVILALAAFFRFYLITEIPPGLYPDEAANGNNALEALRTGSFKIFYPENNGREGLFINLQSLAIKFFGAEPGALRLVSAVFGMLTVLGIYLLTRELFTPNPKPETRNPKQAPNPNDQNLKRFGIWNLENWNLFRISDLEFRISRGQFIGLLSAFFLATSYWHINFSRIGFRAIMVPFFAVFGMYWLLKALRTEKISSTVLAGIFTGLGFYTYIAFRFMPFVLAVPILTALVSWLRGKQAQRCVPCVVALYLFITLIVALPIGFYFLQNPQDFFGRGGQVSIFAGESPLYEFTKSNALTFGMFNFRGDCNQRHNLACEPQLFWPVGILFIIGLIITVREAFLSSQKFEARSTKSETNPNVQNPNNPNKFGISNLENSNLFRISNFEFRILVWILLIWFIFLMLPATLTREGLPHALRSIGMIPAVMILAGLGGAWLWQAIRGYLDRALENPAYERYHRQIQRIKKEIAVAAVLFLVWIPINTYRDYFIRFAYSEDTQGAFAADLWRQGQYLAGLPDETKKIVIVNLMGDDIRGIPAPAQTLMFATDTFDENRRRERNLHYVKRLGEIKIDSSERQVIIVMNPNDRALIDAIRQQFPLPKAKALGDFTVFEN